ncbi:hypothetical protein JL193_14860 [Polaribacter batillariae]|uniref:DUF5723 domain-containing protein n=1 Tax=Polaribacter batillariae TaxID=2808900 RepID=A0ABX7ST84_9FLAO|nr:hypothetical protein [Polaribacter batillariae]QTD37361.1 hypothetical protein JL193_14860 [Polaribacter batillariae]
MKNYIFLLTALFLSQFVFSQSKVIPNKITQKTFAKVDFLSINMPQLEIPNEPNMGFSGIHYNLFLNKDFYTGLGIYGSVTGIRGGFFTLGINAGYKKNITNKLYLDTGFHFGGGGGASAKDGGGAFILPHANLGYDFKYFSLNAGWSYVNFFDKGLIRGNQLNVALEIPLDFEYSNYTASENEFSIAELKNSNWNQKTNRISLMMHLNNLKVTSKANATTGEILNGKIIRLAGFELASYLTDNWFAFLKVDGAYSGIRAGYMDVFLGGGYHLSMNKNRTNIQAKFGIGAGGGGGVDTQGGFLLYPDISIEQKIYNDLYISLNKGFLLTPNRYFATSSFGAGLKYYIERNGTYNNSSNFNEGIFKGFEVVVKQDWYFNAKRMKPPAEDMHQISLQINLDLNKNIFVAGQTSFANFGNAGAYAEGLVGLGVKTNPLFNGNTTFFTQILGGAAGGGGISTGEGLIVKPSLGIDYQINKTLSLRSSAGYVKAKGGSLSNPFINLGIKYNFSFLKLK